MSPFQQNITRRAKRQKMQFEETEQASEPDPGVARMLKLLGNEFKSVMANMLRALMEK